MNVVNTLLPVTIVKLRYGLQLNDNLIVTNEVGLEDVVENDAIISDVILFLTLIRDTPLLELNLKSVLVHLLSEPLTKHLMHPHGRTNDSIRFFLIYDVVLTHLPVYFYIKKLV